MERKSGRRGPGAATAQGARPALTRETMRPPAAPRALGVARVLVRHLLWFLPFYLGLASAAALARAFYASGLQEPRWMLAALVAATGGLLAEYPWARLVGRWGTVGGAAVEPGRGAPRGP